MKDIQFARAQETILAQANVIERLMTELTITRQTLEHAFTLLDKDYDSLPPRSRQAMTMIESLHIEIGKALEK